MDTAIFRRGSNLSRLSDTEQFILAILKSSEAAANTATCGTAQYTMYVQREQQEKPTRSFRWRSPNHQFSTTSCPVQAHRHDRTLCIFVFICQSRFASGQKCDTAVDAFACVHFLRYACIIIHRTRKTCTCQMKIHTPWDDIGHIDFTPFEETVATSIISSRIPSVIDGLSDLCLIDLQG